MKFETHRISISAIIVMLSITMSRITGFVREMLIPNFIGINNMSDAYNMAFRITGLMYDLLVGGAIAAAVVPTLSGYIAKNEEKDGWSVVSNFMNIIIVIMIILCAAGMIFSPQIVEVTTGFKSIAEKELTAKLTRILFPSVALLMLTGLSNGVLYSYNKFALAAFGPTVYNVCCCISIITFGNVGIQYVTMGVVCSSLIYCILQITLASRNLRYYKFKIWLKQPGLAQMFELAIPSLIASSVSQLNVTISASFATLFGDGSVTILNMADRTWQMPYGVFAVGIAVAMLPNMSKAFAVGNLERYKEILYKAITSVLVIVIPAAVGMMILNQTFIRTIFRFSNRVDVQAIHKVGGILSYFCIALVTQSVVTVLCRAFYAKKDAKTPLGVAINTIILTVVLSIAFLKWTNLGVGGMALAYSIASFINAVALLTLLHRKLHGIHIRRLLKFLLKTSAAVAIMAVILLILDNLLAVTDSFTKIEQIALVGLEVAIGAGCYFVLCLLFRVEEIVRLKSVVVRKIARIAGALGLQKG